MQTDTYTCPMTGRRRPVPTREQLSRIKRVTFVERTTFAQLPVGAYYLREGEDNDLFFKQAQPMEDPTTVQHNIAPVAPEVPKFIRNIKPAGVRVEGGFRPFTEQEIRDRIMNQVVIHVVPAPDTDVDAPALDGNG